MLAVGLVSFALGTPAICEETGSQPAAASDTGEMPARAAHKDAALHGRALRLSPELHFIERRTGITVPAGQTVALAGDFDGDGRSEPAWFIRESVSLFVVHPGAARSSAQSWTLDGLMYQPDHAAAGRFDSDRCTDLVLLSAAGGKLSFAHANCTGRFVIAREVPLSEPVASDILFAGDLDGDELSEVVLRTVDGHRFIILGGDGTIRPDMLRSERAHSHIRALADIDGDGRAEILAGGDRGLTALYAIRGLSDIRVHAAVPDERMSTFTFGDLNGDGRMDLVMERSDPRRWWVAFGNIRTGLERPLSPPFALPRKLSMLTAVDINQDGLDDLVGVESGTSELFIAETVPNPGIGGAQILIDGRLSSVSDDNGRFTAELDDKGTHTIRIDHPRYQFSPESRAVQSSDAKPLIFAGAETKTPIGQQVALGWDPPGPYLCTGYNPVERVDESDRDLLPETVRWGSFERTGKYCADGYALFSVDSRQPNPLRNRPLYLSGVCCRLPKSDILTQEEVLAVDACPENFVVTGALFLTNAPDERQRLRCTKINLERYRLAEPQPGMFWGIGASTRGQQPRVSSARIPLALRTGFLRGNRAERRNKGCAGFPWGSLYVAGYDDLCRNYRFRRLLYRGAAGDPSDGTPVPMFPACAAIANRFDPATGCVDHLSYPFRDTGSPDL